MLTKTGGESPLNFDYKLIDIGDGRRLEQFGSYIIDRPCPVAEKIKKSDIELWSNRTAFFDDETGWQIAENLFKEWTINVLDFTVRLKLSPSGQVGIFPEQYPNWSFLRDIADTFTSKLTILNGFAYTGVSTLCTVNGINETIHVDGSSSAINWAKENFKMNFNSSGAKFINEDMMTFIYREVKRRKRYNGFIFDPPEFGRGPKGEWSLKKDLPKLIDSINLLADDPQFLIFTTHSQWLTKKELANLMSKVKFIDKNYDIFDLNITSETNKTLNLGFCFRWHKK